MTAKKQLPLQQPQGDETRIQEVLASRAALAEALHGFVDRKQAEEAFTAIFTADETTQVALLKRLVRERDVDAADILLAVNELAPLKTVRKEARRGLLQLAGAKIYPSWTPTPEKPAVGNIGAAQAPRFWKGSVAEMRESGELQLVLCWEQGFEYSEARVISFLLDFWRDGVKDFFTEAGSKRHIEEHVSEIYRTTRAAAVDASGEEEELPVKFVDCTLAEGRRLLNEALSVNRWRKTEPEKDFRHYLSLVQQLILHTQEAGEDRGLTFIAPGLEPDMLAANFAGGWSMGDYGLCYDLLARDSALLEGHDREEWMQIRRSWADEAHPSRFELYFLREREQHQQSSLWLPSSVLSKRASEQKEVELGWSLELAETQLSGTLPEMPMGTAVYKETGRHWFWTIFTLVQEDGEWRISRIKDEGSALQGLPLHELQQRLKEYDEAIQKILQEHQPTDPDSQQYYEEMLWRSWQILSFDDALLVKNSLDKEVYEDAYARALSMRAVERAAVYAEALIERFPNDPDHLMAVQRLGALQAALGERFASLGLKDRAAYFNQRGEETLRGSLREDDPMGHLLLAEFLVGKEEPEAAKQELLKARDLAQERDIQAQIESDLANIAINQDQFAEAQGYLEHLAEIEPNHPELWTTLGLVHRSQQNYPEAIVYYQRAIEEEPADVRPYAELGGIFLEQEELDKARDVLLQGIRALPQSAHLRALLALVYYERKDRRRAEEYLQEAEQLNPNLEMVQAVRGLMKKK